MFSQRYPLEWDGHKRLLEISWKLFWRDFAVRLDGQIIGTVPGGMRELKAGRDFQLPGGSVIRIRLDRGYLTVSRDGVHLPGSPLPPAPPAPGPVTPTSPIRTIALAAALIASLAILGVVLYGTLWVPEKAFFHSWSTAARCLAAFAIFAGFLAFTFFTSLKTWPKTPRDWLAAVRSYIERYVEMAGNDPWRGS